MEEATAQCIVDHCAGAEQDDEGNDLAPRENRRVSKGGADEASDLLNKQGVRLNEKGGNNNDDDDRENSSSSVGPQQKDNFEEMFNRNLVSGGGATAISVKPKTTSAPSTCPTGHYMYVKPCPPGYASNQKCVECRKLSSAKYATDIYSRPISYYGNMSRYSAYESRMKWKGGRGGRDDDHDGRDRDRDNHHWDNKHVWRLPRPIIRSNVVVYNPFAYYYAPPPPVYYPPVYPFAYW